MKLRTLVIAIIVLASILLSGVQSEKTTDLDDDKIVDVPKTDGFIIEFVEEPVIIKKTEIEKNKLRKTEFVKKREVLNYKNKIKKQQEKKILEISKRLGKDNEAIKQKIKNKFTNVFNGIVMNITADEANKLRKLEGIKAIYPNYEVQATLMDSVPLIEADFVWSIDADLNKDGNVDANDLVVVRKDFGCTENCEGDINRDGITDSDDLTILRSKFGMDCYDYDECLTGKGVTIAIIDTGVDYNHPDLGGNRVSSSNFEQTITNDSIPQSFPAIYGDKIVWEDYRNSNSDIYMYDVSTAQETRITTSSLDQLHPDIYGNKIVWQQFMNTNLSVIDIYMYDISTGETTRITTNPSVQDKPAIYENRIVWQDYRHGNWEIYMWDQVNGERRITSDSNMQLSPDIFDNIIVWEDYRNGNADIYMYDLSTGQETQITNSLGKQQKPRVYRNKIVWEDYGSTNIDVYTYDISTGQKTMIGRSDISGAWTPSPDIYENRIVWQDHNRTSGLGWSDMYMYDIGTTETKASTCEKKFVREVCRIYGDKMICTQSLPYEGESDMHLYFLEAAASHCNASDPFPNSKIIGGYDFVNNDNDPIDDNGHGTHVAGVAAGKGIDKDNDNIYCEFAEGEICGVAPDASILSYKVLNSGGTGSQGNIIAALELANDPNQDGDFSDRADIISLSLGGFGNPNDALSQAVDNAVDNGIVVITAGGNSGPAHRTIRSPGTARKAITVGAVYNKNYFGDYWGDIDPIAKQIAVFSSEGPTQIASSKPDIVAPGVIICSAASSSIIGEENCLDSEHIAMSGTSMATPMVSGVAALLKQKNPNWTPEEIKYTLLGTAEDLGNSPFAQGAGLVNARNAVEAEKSYPIAQIELEKFAFSSGENINSKIRASGDNIKYRVFYAKAKDYLPISSYELIYEAGGSYNGTIPLAIDTNSFEAGDAIILKLEVQNDAGISNSYAHALFPPIKQSFPIEGHIITPPKSFDGNIILRYLGIISGLDGLKLFSFSDGEKFSKLRVFSSEIAVSDI